MTSANPEAGAEPRWLDQDEQEVWRAFLDVSRLLFDHLGRQLLQDGDLTLAEYDILVQLSETQGRRLRMSELADLVVSSRSRITHTVARMEERGLVRREACPEDGRGVRCVLTDRGFFALVEAAPGHAEAVRSVMFDPLAPKDVTAVGDAMAKVRAALRAR